MSIWEELKPFKFWIFLLMNMVYTSPFIKVFFLSIMFHRFWSLGLAYILLDLFLSI